MLLAVSKMFFNPSINLEHYVGYKTQITCVKSKIGERYVMVLGLELYMGKQFFTSDVMHR